MEKIVILAITVSLILAAPHDADIREPVVLKESIKSKLPWYISIIRKK